MGLVEANGLFDFFSHSTWTVIRNLTAFFVAVFWLATAFWVYKDARRRIEDPWLVGMATVLGLIPPFVGPLIYMLFRPPEYLEDVRERELEIKAMEERLARRDLHCPVCRAEVEAASSSARSARRGCGSRAATARRRSRRSGRSARTARRRSSRWRRVARPDAGARAAARAPNAAP